MRRGNYHSTKGVAMDDKAPFRIPITDIIDLCLLHLSTVEIRINALENLLMNKGVLVSPEELENAIASESKHLTDTFRKHRGLEVSLYHELIRIRKETLRNQPPQP
jgi:hypothetical protein